MLESKLEENDKLTKLIDKSAKSKFLINEIEFHKDNLTEKRLGQFIGILFNFIEGKDDYNDISTLIDEYINSIPKNKYFIKLYSDLVKLNKNDGIKRIITDLKKHRIDLKQLFEFNKFFPIYDLSEKIVSDTDFIFQTISAENISLIQLLMDLMGFKNNKPKLKEFYTQLVKNLDSFNKKDRRKVLTEITKIAIWTNDVDTYSSAYLKIYDLLKENYSNLRIEYLNYIEGIINNFYDLDFSETIEKYLNTYDHRIDQNEILPILNLIDCTHDSTLIVKYILFIFNKFYDDMTLNVKKETYLRLINQIDPNSNWLISNISYFENLFNRILQQINGYDECLQMCQKQIKLISHPKIKETLLRLYEKVEGLSKNAKDVFTYQEVSLALAEAKGYDKFTILKKSFDLVELNLNHKSVKSALSYIQSLTSMDDQLTWMKNLEKIVAKNNEVSLYKYIKIKQIKIYKKNKNYLDLILCNIDLIEHTKKMDTKALLFIDCVNIANQQELDPVFENQIVGKAREFLSIAPKTRLTSILEKAVVRHMVEEGDVREKVLLVKEVVPIGEIAKQWNIPISLGRNLLRQFSNKGYGNIICLGDNFVVNTKILNRYINDILNLPEIDATKFGTENQLPPDAVDWIIDYAYQNQMIISTTKTGIYLTSQRIDERIYNYLKRYFEFELIEASKELDITISEFKNRLFHWIDQDWVEGAFDSKHTKFVVRGKPIPLDEHKGLLSSNEREIIDMFITALSKDGLYRKAAMYAAQINLTLDEIIIKIKETKNIELDYIGSDLFLKGVSYNCETCRKIDTQTKFFYRCVESSHNFCPDCYNTATKRLNGWCPACAGQEVESLMVKIIKLKAYCLIDSEIEENAFWTCDNPKHEDKTQICFDNIQTGLFCNESFDGCGNSPTIPESLEVVRSKLLAKSQEDILGDHPKGKGPKGV